MDLKGKNVLVIGTGLSGIGAVHLLHHLGAATVLLEQNEKAQADAIRDKLEEEDRTWPEIMIGELPQEIKASLDLVVPSPAVPLDSPLLTELERRGVPIWSEVELASRVDRGRILAITGTNGKTTTTTLVGEIMKAFQKNVFVVGNIGYSYAAVAEQTDETSVSVGEISSFQLEAAVTFRPCVSAILNITPDHLNRHYTMDNYAAIKERIAMNQSADEVCVLNYEDPRLYAFGRYLCPAHVIWFSSVRELRDGFWYDHRSETICFSKDGISETWMNIHDMRLVGICNVENVMAAMAITMAAGVPRETILEVIHNFAPVEHRIEFVAVKNGVTYYNDSKATNPDAAIQGIRAMCGPTVLIGGGYDKKNSYDEWIEAFDGKVKELVLIGQTADDIEKCARAHGLTQISRFDTFEECLAHCTQIAEEGDAVLLSPACASWGMFPNYEVRGQMFKEYVHAL